MRALLILLALAFVPALRADDLAAFRNDALARINAFRQEQGLGAVRLDDTLNGVSLDWAKHLTEVGSMVHRTPDNLKELMHENAWRTINENLFDSVPASNAATVVETWKKSPPHRRNLLQPNIDRIGLGTAVGEGGRFFAVFNGAGAPMALKRDPGFSSGYQGSSGF